MLDWRHAQQVLNYAPSIDRKGGCFKYQFCGSPQKGDESIMQVKVGCAENIIEVPLFAELGGYGPFLGRRNRGVRDPLYARVLTVNDGVNRNVVVVTDTISSSEIECRKLRMELASEFVIDPEGIMFIATHTHSAAGVASCDVGYGEPSAEFCVNWRATVRKSLQEALANEEPCRAFAGKAPIRKQLGARRTTSEDKHTDPEIRWVKLVREDGSTKVLVHNHAMHGVVFGAQPLVSADWMGDANRKIKERKLADIGLFMYGTAGDVNVIWTHGYSERDKNLEWISESYVNDLEADLGNGEEISLAPVKASLKAVVFPTEEVDPVEYRAIAETLISKVPNRYARPQSQEERLLFFTHDRLLEMAILAERGKDFRVMRDLQTIRMGDLAIYAVPGEPFLAVGEELRARSPFKFPIAVSVANGDAGYFPTPEMFAQYPSIFSCDDFGAFGFYEVWFGQGMHRPKFKPNIIEHIVNHLLTLDVN